MRIDRDTSSAFSAPAEIPVLCRRIVAVGDTQGTLLLERLLLGRESNGEPRSRLLGRLAGEEADAVVHLGDLVADATSVPQWEQYDRLMAPIRGRGIGVYPALGNHDYGETSLPAIGPWRSRRLARSMAEVAARFPWLAGPRRRYERRYGRLRLIWLDTNEADQTAGAWTEQQTWFAQRLADADADGDVGGVIVFAHHPPYTNSRATGDELHVQRAFVPAFAAARKTLAMISGHVHAYERFVMDGKTYIVSGGGGGPRVRLRAGRARRHADRCDLPSPRPLHYLVLECGGRSIEVRAMGLGEGNRLEVFDLVELQMG